jgi:hypothetical protein
MKGESEPFGFALSEEDEERLDRVLLESGREPICVRLKRLMETQRWNAVIFTERTGLEGYLFSKINNFDRRVAVLEEAIKHLGGGKK